MLYVQLQSSKMIFVQNRVAEIVDHAPQVASTCPVGLSERHKVIQKGARPRETSGRKLHKTFRYNLMKNVRKALSFSHTLKAAVLSTLLCANFGRVVSFTQLISISSLLPPPVMRRSSYQRHA